MCLNNLYQIQKDIFLQIYQSWRKSSYTKPSLEMVVLVNTPIKQSALTEFHFLKEGIAANIHSMCVQFYGKFTQWGDRSIELIAIL